MAHFSAGRARGDEDMEEELMQRAKRRLKRQSSQEPSASRIHRIRRAAGGVGTVPDLAMVVVRSRAFEAFILLVIAANAVYIGVETDYQGDKLEAVAEILGPVIFSIYLGEMLLKFTAYQDMFFRVPMEGKWNMFETGLVMISLVDLTLGGMSRQAGGGWTGLLTLRLLRLINSLDEGDGHGAQSGQAHVRHHQVRAGHRLAPSDIHPALLGVRRPVNPLLWEDGDLRGRLLRAAALREHGAHVRNAVRGGNAG